MTISPEIKIELERRARQSRDVHERLRLCVVLARSEGMSPESIAQAHRISVQSVYRYLLDYELETKTQHDPRGGSKSKLDELQSKELLDHLQKTTYTQITSKPIFEVIWVYLHVKEICKYIKSKYGADYSKSGMAHSKIF